MDITIRLMWPQELPEVIAIYRAVHKFATDRTEANWFLLPTLVAAVHDGGEVPDFALAGYTTMVMGPDKVFHNMETCVLPEFRGQGIGRKLFTARMDVAQNSGASVVLATVEDDNLTMQKIAIEFGLHACQMWVYPDGSKGKVYVRQLRQV
jgi:GNAT superfamily N-acetyltransferase